MERDAPQPHGWAAAAAAAGRASLGTQLHAEGLHLGLGGGDLGPQSEHLLGVVQPAPG